MTSNLTFTRKKKMYFNMITSIRKISVLVKDRILDSIQNFQQR